MNLRTFQAVLDDEKLTRAKFTVMLVLAFYANQQNEAWPRVAVLAKRARIKPRHAYRTLKWLLSEGYLTVIEGPTNRKSTTYRLCVPAMVANVTPPAENDTPPLTPRTDEGDSQDALGVTSARTDRAAPFNRPINKYNINRSQQKESRNETRLAKYQPCGWHGCNVMTVTTYCRDHENVGRKARR